MSGAGRGGGPGAPSPKRRRLSTPSRDSEASAPSGAADFAEEPTRAADGGPTFGLPSSSGGWVEVARAPVAAPPRRRSPTPAMSSDGESAPEAPAAPLPAEPIFGGGEGAEDGTEILLIPEVRLCDLVERKGRRYVEFRGRAGEHFVFRPHKSGESLEFFVDGKRRRPFRKVNWTACAGSKGGQLSLPDAGYHFSVPRGELPKVLGGLRALAGSVGAETNIGSSVALPRLDRLDDRLWATRQCERLGPPEAQRQPAAPPTGQPSAWERRARSPPRGYDVFGAGETAEADGGEDTEPAAVRELPCSGQPLADNPELYFAFASEKGQRETMEDAHVLMQQLPGAAAGDAFLMVCDGHGGDVISRLAAERIPAALAEQGALLREDPATAFVRAFTEVDRGLWRSLKQREKGGSTVAAVLLRRGALWVANLGDCRAVLCEGGRAVELSRDHRASCPSEQDRVRRCGGSITSGVQHKGKVAQGERVVCPGSKTAVQVTRALGDFSLKGKERVLSVPPSRMPLTSVPEISRVALTPGSEFLVLACDGLWDVVSSAEAVSAARQHAHRGPRHMARELLQLAFDRGTTDNVTVVVASFAQPRPASAADVGASPLALQWSHHVETGRARTEYNPVMKGTTQVGGCDHAFVAVGDLDAHCVARLQSPSCRPEALAEWPLLRRAVTEHQQLVRHAAGGGLPGPLPRLALFAVMDGHGGSAAAAFAEQWLPLLAHRELLSLLLDGEGGPTPLAQRTEGQAHGFAAARPGELKPRLAAAVRALDDCFAERCRRGAPPAGRRRGELECCSLSAALFVGNVLCVASVGDCAVQLCRSGGSGRLAAQCLSGQGHGARGAAEAEVARVRRAGGFLYEGQAMGVLRVTRCIGAEPLKRPGGEIDLLWRPPGWDAVQEHRARPDDGDGSAVVTADADCAAFAPRDGVELFLLIAPAALWEVTPRLRVAEWIHSRLQGSAQPESFPDLDNEAEKARTAAALVEGVQRAAAAVAPYAAPLGVHNLPRACRDLCRDAVGRGAHSVATLVVALGRFGAAAMPE
eukprot:TRINITY_DN19814_c0_g1_i4.p1 TRINITY_DN19814_c0_g1~~TRINITY_DN19814_c0_g1_i4.p1  ORF type:complete len:1040 (+),score=241.41 TRINITY_DN19814_c0_g1_i4:62-3181(+)